MAKEASDHDKLIELSAETSAANQYLNQQLTSINGAVNRLEGKMDNTASKEDITKVINRVEVNEKRIRAIENYQEVQKTEKKYTGTVVSWIALLISTIAAVMSALSRFIH